MEGKNSPCRNVTIPTSLPQVRRLRTVPLFFNTSFSLSEVVYNHNHVTHFAHKYIRSSKPSHSDTNPLSVSTIYSHVCDVCISSTLILLNRMNHGTPIPQSYTDEDTRSKTEKSPFDSRQGQKIFLVSNGSKPAVGGRGHTHPSRKWVSAAPSRS